MYVWKCCPNKYICVTNRNVPGYSRKNIMYVCDGAFMYVFVCVCVCACVCVCVCVCVSMLVPDVQCLNVFFSFFRKGNCFYKFVQITLITKYFAISSGTHSLTATRYWSGLKWVFFIFWGNKCESLHSVFPLHLITDVTYLHVTWQRTHKCDCELRSSLLRNALNTSLLWYKHNGCVK